MVFCLCVLVLPRLCVCVWHGLDASNFGKNECVPSCLCVGLCLGVEMVTYPHDYYYYYYYY